ncbi:MAG: sulfotransferase [Pseudomonadales bacterium]
MSSSNTANSQSDSVDEASAPFFIFGCGRSGTSLLSRMISSHPNLTVPLESHIFNSFSALEGYYGDLSQRPNRLRLIEDILSTQAIQGWQLEASIDDIERCVKSPDLGGVFDAIMQSWTSSKNKKRWGEKTPRHVFHWDDIHRHYPNAKIVHIVRDGRDVALSFMDARFGPKTSYMGAVYWKHYLQKVRQLQVAESNVLEVHYEDLLADPETTLTAVCEFLGEEYSDDMLRFYDNSLLYTTDSRNRVNLQSALMQSNTCKWRDQFSDADLERFEAVAGDELRLCGYELTSEEKLPQSSTTEYLYQKYFISAPKRFIAMLKNVQGHREAWIMLSIRMRIMFSLLRYR